MAISVLDRLHDKMPHPQLKNRDDLPIRSFGCFTGMTKTSVFLSPQELLAMGEESEFTLLPLPDQRCNGFAHDADIGFFPLFAPSSSKHHLQMP